MDQPGTAELMVDPPVESAATPLLALEATDSVRRQREILHRRSREATPDSLRALVIANFEALRDGLPVRDLAKRSGHAHSAVNRAFKKLAREVGEELGIL